MQRLRNTRRPSVLPNRNPSFISGSRCSARTFLLHAGAGTAPSLRPQRGAETPPFFREGHQGLPKRPIASSPSGMTLEHALQNIDEDPISQLQEVRHSSSSSNIQRGISRYETHARSVWIGVGYLGQYPRKKYSRMEGVELVGLWTRISGPKRLPRGSHPALLPSSDCSGRSSGPASRSTPLHHSIAREFFNTH